MKTVYEEVFGKPNPNSNELMREASERAQKNLDDLEKKYPGTKRTYNDIFKRMSYDLAEKFICVKALIEDEDFFRTYAKYIDADFFKDETIDILADIVVFMKNSLAKGRPFNMFAVRRYIKELRPSSFPVSAYAEDYRNEILRNLSSLDDIPEKILNAAKADTLLLCLQRNTMRRILSDPEVYLAMGYDQRIKGDIERLTDDEDAMMDALNKFDEEKELVKEVQFFLRDYNDVNPADI